MKKILLIVIAMIMTACLQGPWSYTPEVRTVDRGVLVNAYIVADRPLSDVCFERLYDLDETYTNAWAFFDSATVEITGDYGNGVETIELLQNPDKPMCFIGADDKVGQRGNAYTLDGVFWWDSSGREVRSVISGEAKIPTSINVGNTGWASSLVLSNDQPVNNQEGILAMFGNLPDSVSMFLLEKYLEEINSLGDDSLAQQKWLRENGVQLNAELDSLLAVYIEYVEYDEGDTVAYLDGNLNTTSHYYKMNASDDVGGILVTQRIEDDAFSPKTRFDEIAENFGGLDAAQFYTSSNIRRLIYYSNFVGEGYELFDSLGVLNTWFKEGKNVFYFYATDSNYNVYANDNISQESNTKVEKKSFISGGNGIFAGMVVDSFVLNIRIPENVLSYSAIESHAAFCNEESWDSEDCREFNYEYCEVTSYNDRQYSMSNPDLFEEVGSYNTCLGVLVEKSYGENKDAFDLIDSIFPQGGWPVLDTESKNESVEPFTQENLDDAQKFGLEQHCFKNDFSTPACAELIDSCQSFSAESDCRNNLWNYCIDNKWSSPSCDWGLHMYCLQSDVKSEILCGEVHNNFCENSPQENVCKLES